MVLIGQLQELLVAGRVAGTVTWGDHRSGGSGHDRGGVAVLWVSTPMTTSTTSASMAIGCARCPEDDVVGAGPGPSTAGL
jgi:hypothetical protein